MSTNAIFTHQPVQDHAPDPAPLRLADRPPPWRRLAAKPEPSAQTPRRPRPMDADQSAKGDKYLSDEDEARMVNAALVLRRPLLVTGSAGVGKSSLAYAVARQLGLGNVLRWSITSRSTLKDALYLYDAIARLHDASLREKGLLKSDPQIGDYITLGPLGTALLPTGAAGYFPRVLLIDEIDKSDADLPSDLLHVLEEGSFVIPEIARLPPMMKGNTVQVRTCDPAVPFAQVPADGAVRSDDFPLILMTSNADRDFPPAFMRRCLQLKIEQPNRERLLAVARAYFGAAADEDAVKELVALFDEKRKSPGALLSTDQLLNAICLTRSDLQLSDRAREAVLKSVFASLLDSPQVNTTP